MWGIPERMLGRIHIHIYIYIPCTMLYHIPYTICYMSIYHIHYMPCTGLWGPIDESATGSSEDERQPGLSDRDLGWILAVSIAGADIGTFHLGCR